VKHTVSTLLNSKPARIAILGADGVGKSSLALATLHQPEVASAFGVHRFYVSCDSATCAKELGSVLTKHFGLDDNGKPIKSIVRHLAALATPMVLVLDGIDNCWRPHEKRGEVEDFLSLLADIQHLSLVVTLRGAERPRQVRWTRPFLPVLQPLPAPAALETFLDISDVPADDPQLEELLTLTDNNPLTVTIVAGLASFEGCASLVARWHKEGKTLLKDGLDHIQKLPLQESMVTTVLL